MLFLDPELYLGFIKLQAHRKLGRSFAGLLPFIEGLYQMGYIDKEIYEAHKTKYSQPLVAKKTKTLTNKQLKEKLEEKRLDKVLGNVIDQWDSHPSTDWRDQWFNIAQEHPKLPNSKKILALRVDIEKYDKLINE